MSQRVSMGAVRLYVEAYASRRVAFLHEIGSHTRQRGLASQPVGASDTRLCMQRPTLRAGLQAQVYTAAAGR